LPSSFQTLNSILIGELRINASKFASWTATTRKLDRAALFFLFPFLSLGSPFFTRRRWGGRGGGVSLRDGWDGWRSSFVSYYYSLASWLRASLVLRRHSLLPEPPKICQDSRSGWRWRHVLRSRCSVPSYSRIAVFRKVPPDTCMPTSLAILFLPETFLSQT
jgi:hypothetical protein